MNPWEKYQSPNNATTAPAPAGIIRGAPKQPDRFEVEDQQIKRQAAQRADIASQRADRSLQLQEQSAQRTAQKDNLEIEKTRQEQEALGQAKINTIGSLRKTIAELKQIRGDTEGDWFETGTTGNIARAIPLVGNDAKGLSSRLVGIKAQNAFSALQDLAAKGVKLTPISNAEIELAAASIANLDPTQNEKTFLGQLDKASSFYSDLLAKLEAEVGNTQPNQSIEQTPNQSGFEGDESRGPEVVIREGGDVLQNPTGGGETADLDSQGGFKFLQDGESHSDAQKQLITSFFEQNKDNQSLTSFEALQFLRDNNIPIGDRDILEQRINEAKSGKEVNPIFSQSDYDAFISDRADSFENRDTLLGISDNKAGFGTRAQEGLLLGFNDEIAGVGGGLGSLLSGGEFGEGYQLQRDVQRELNDRANQRTGLAGDVVEIGSGLALPGSAAGTSLRSAAKTGAGFGAVGGFGYGEGASGSATNALIGGAGGGLLGAGGQRIGNALVNRSANKGANSKIAQEVRENIDVLRAAKEEGLEANIRQPDVRPSLRDKFGGAEASEYGGPLIQKAAKDDADALQGRLNALGGDGTPKDDYNLGEGVKRAVVDEKNRQSQQTSALFRRVELQAPNFSIKPTRQSSNSEANALLKGNDAAQGNVADQLIGNIDNAIEGIKSRTPKGAESEIKFLETLKHNFTENGISIQNIQAQKSLVSNYVGQKSSLTYQFNDVVFQEVIRDANKLLERGLQESGNDAALQTLKRANKEYGDYVDFKKTIYKELVGDNNRELFSEGTGRRIISMIKTGGDSEKFAKVFKLLPDAEKTDLRALIAQNLGSNAKGDFSVGYLASNLSDKKINSRVLREVFGDDGFKSLMNLRTIADAKVRASGGKNFSNTSRANQNKPTGAGDFVRGVIGFFAGGPAGAAGGVLGPKIAGKLSEKSTAKLLLNSDFTKWLKDFPNTKNPKAIDRYFSKLGAVSKAHPAIAGDVQSFQNLILQAANDNASRAAAENDR